MHLAIVLHNELAAAPIGDAHAHTGVFHGAGDAHRVAVLHGLVIGGLDASRVSTRPVELSTIWPLGRTPPGRMALR